MVFGGYTVARDLAGAVVLVKGALPGETFTAHITSRKGVRFGTVASVLEASPHRVNAPKHPGLDYGHIAYEQQLVYKQDVFADSVRRIREAFPEHIPITRSPNEWHYRNTVQPAVLRREGLGYRAPGTHDIQVLPSDPVAFPALNTAWALLAERVRSLGGVREVVLRSNRVGDTLVAFVATEPARNYHALAHELVQHGVAGVSYAPFDPRGRFRGGAERLAGARTISETHGAFTVAMNAHAFTQVNPGAADTLYARVAELVPAGRRALELYAGTGVLGMHVAHQFTHVDAFEIDRSATTRGQRAAAAAGIDNMAFHTGDVAKFAAQFTDADVIIVDPPRAGLAGPVRAAITASRASDLLYVSCDPATFARDSAEFLANGWQVAHAELFDFFPQTHHVEVVALLQRTT